jgi:hypothetical protein
VNGDQAWSLFCACADGDEAKVRSLIGADADLTHAQVRYSKPVNLAIRQSHVGIVWYLLESDLRGWLSSKIYEDFGRRELQHRGFTEMDRLLIDHQLERAPRFSPDFGNLAGHIQARDFNQVKRALRNREQLHASDLAGNGPLHHAVRVNAFDIVEYLVEAGADINAENARGATPLDLSLKEVEVTWCRTGLAGRWVRPLGLDTWSRPGCC